MTADSLAARRLHSLCGGVLDSGFIAGSTKLYEIERAAWDYFYDCSDIERTVCYVIATLFERLAKSQDGETVSADQGARLLNILGQPIRQCIDHLIGHDVGKDSLQLVRAITDAYHKANPFNRPN